MFNILRLLGLKPNKEQKAETLDSSGRHIANAHVGSSLFQSTKELFPISDRFDLTKLDYHFSIRYFGDEEVRIPYVPLSNYLHCVEMLQAAEYQISVLQEVVSSQAQANQ